MKLLALIENKPEILISIAIAVIAYWQWNTNELKRKRELFDLRLENIVLVFTGAIEKLYSRHDSSNPHLNGRIFVEDTKYKTLSQFREYSFLIKDKDVHKLESAFEELCNSLCILIEMDDAFAESVKEQGIGQDMTYTIEHSEQYRKFYKQAASFRKTLDKIMKPHLNIEKDSLFDKLIVICRKLRKNFINMMKKYFPTYYKFFNLIKEHLKQFKEKLRELILSFKKYLKTNIWDILKNAIKADS